MTPEQARAARALLNLEMKTVCDQAPIGKRTLTEFERGARIVNNSTLSRLKAFYISKGVDFRTSGNGDQIVCLIRVEEFDRTSNQTIHSKFEYEDYFQLHRIIGDVESLVELINRISLLLNFSQTIMSIVINKTNNNQKKIANELECSSAFVSSILLGKKLIPASLTDKINSKYKLPDFSQAALSEREIKTHVSELRRATDNILIEIRRLKALYNYQS